MLYIEKGKEPESLTKYRKEKFAHFNGFEKKDDIRKKLLEEQGCLCAYCMRRIDIEHMKIEHWYPEERLSDVETLDYYNMLGVCLGHMDGTKGTDDTCDTHKKNTVITVDPRDKATLAKVQYRTSTGEIYSDDILTQKDLNQTLNLNSDRHLLKMNRKAAFDSAIREMVKLQPEKTWNRKFVETVKAQYGKTDSNGKKKEFAGIVLWYLEKRLLSRRLKRLR